MIGIAATTATTPHRKPGKGRGKPMTHPVPRTAMYRRINEVRFLSQFQNHCLTAVPVRLAVSEEHSVKGDQQACLTSGYQVKMHQDECYTTSAPENYPPALGRNGNRVGDKPSKGYTFYEHVGSLNSKGQASTRKWRLQDQNFLADTVGACAPPVSLRLLIMAAESLTALTAPDVPAALDIGLSSDYRDAVRNAVYEQSGVLDRWRWMGGGKRVATRRRAPIKSSVPKYRVT